MKHAVFILVVLIYFSGCGALTREQYPSQLTSGSTVRQQNNYQAIPAGYGNNNASIYYADYNGNSNILDETPAQTISYYNMFVLVTSDITSKLLQLRSSVDVLEDMSKLKFKLSGRFNLIMPVMNNGPKIGNNGAFIDRSQNTKTINFDITDIGRLRTIIYNAPLGKEAFIIVFQKDGEIIPLGFKKSSYSDSYILSSVDYGTERYIIQSQDGLPHLCIYMAQPILPNILATPFSTLDSLYFDPIFAPSQPPDDRFTGQVPVMGSGYVSKRGAIAYITSQNPGVNSQILNNLIDMYIEEAAFEGVNHDIAIVQMLYTTNYLRNNMSSYNYAGLSASGVNRWDGNFPNMRTGVRAHIQHLKGYGSTQPPRNQIVDPRYYLLGVMQGKVRNLSQLCEVWSHNGSYENNITSKLYSMYQYADM